MTKKRKPNKKLAAKSLTKASAKTLARKPKIRLSKPIRDILAEAKEWRSLRFKLANERSFGNTCFELRLEMQAVERRLANAVDALKSVA
jgi:hypothetical protein